jgi:hypothetical protein
MPGYEAGADAGSGELLAEAQAPQEAFFDLNGKSRRPVALDELAMAVRLGTIEHREGCGCALCWALEAVNG